MIGKMSFEFKFDAKLNPVQRKAVRAEIVKQLRKKDQGNEWSNWCDLKNLPKTVGGSMREEDIKKYIDARLRTLRVMNSKSPSLTVRKPSNALDYCCLVCGKVICYSLYDVYVNDDKWNFMVSVKNKGGKKFKTEVAVQIALTYEDDQASTSATKGR